MKKTALIKTLAVSAVSCLTISVASMGAVTASADSLGTDELITATNATVTTAVTSGDATGLEVVGTEAHSIAINGVFTEDAKVDMAFTAGLKNARTLPSGSYFKVEDVSDSTNFFTVEYFGTGWDGWYTGVLVRYSVDDTEYVRTIHRTDSIIYTSTPPDECSIVDKASLELKWEGDVLSVIVPQNANSTICKFDGAAEVSFTNGTYAVPKISFANGYKISYHLAGAATTIIEEVSGTSFASETVEEVPTWYSAYAQEITITLEERIKDFYLLSDAVEVVGATYVVGGEGEALPVEKIEVSINNSEFTPVEAGSPIIGAGQYTLRYTAIDSGVNLNNIYTVSFEVYDGEYIEIKDIIGGKVYAEFVDNEEDGTGILIQPEGENTSYEAKINGVFAGDSKIEMSILYGIVNDQKMPAGSYFKVEDATDSSNYFTVEFFGTGWNSWYTGVRVKYSKDGMSYTRAICYDTSEILTSAESTDPAQTIVWGSSLELKWEGDVLSVIVPQNKGTYNTICKFDGAAEVNSSEGAYAVPKISFPDGYKISFGSASLSYVVITNVNGFAIDFPYVLEDAIQVESFALACEEEIVLEVTNEKVDWEDVGVYAVATSKVSINGLEYFITKNIYPTEALAANAVSVGKDYAITYGEESLTVNVIVVDKTAPVITVSDLATRATEGDVIDLGSYSATDNVDETVAVVVEVKFGDTVVTVTDNQFIAENVGTYTVTYKAMDAAGNEATPVVKTIQVEAEAVLPPADSSESTDSSEPTDSSETTDSSKPNDSVGASNSESKGGCFGTIDYGTVGLIALVLVAVVFIAKKKENLN